MEKEMGALSLLAEWAHPNFVDPGLYLKPLEHLTLKAKELQKPSWRTAWKCLEKTYNVEREAPEVVMETKSMGNKI